MKYRLYNSPFVLLSACTSAATQWFCKTGWKIATGACIAYIALPDETYWFLVGVMSSVGLGSGFHTGPLLLFPHVSSTAASAPNLEMAVKQTISPTFFWGLGTAFGELPPFYAGPHLIRTLPRINKLIKRSQESIRNYGAISIFLMACYPNLTFDAAGIAAGAMGMSTSKFLTATVCGKALVKAPLQSAFVIASTRGIMNTQIVSLPDLHYFKQFWTALTSLMILLVAVLMIEYIGNESLDKKPYNTKQGHFVSGASSLSSEGESGLGSTSDEASTVDHISQ